MLMTLMKKYFKTQEAQTVNNHETKDTAWEETAYHVDQANIETIDPTAFQDDLEIDDQNYMDLGNAKISGGDSDTSDADSSSPVLTLNSKNSKCCYQVQSTNLRVNKFKTKANL